MDRPSRSTVQIDVGSYKSGERRHEIRHFNDLKLAHPNSLAAPAVRPKLGRPPKTATPDKSSSPGEPAQQSLPATGETDTAANSVFEGHITGPPNKPAFGRPVRSTRNPNPAYIDALWLAGITNGGAPPA